MKKILLLIITLLSGVGVQASSDNDRPIAVDRLPEAAQAFIAEHFADVRVTLAKVEDDFFDKEYKVIFVKGQKVEFDRRGRWTEVDCRFDAVPPSLVPAFITRYINDKWTDVKVWKIEVDRKDRVYEVKLSNRWELAFDFEGNLTDAEAH